MGILKTSVLNFIHGDFESLTAAKTIVLGHLKMSSGHGHSRGSESDTRSGYKRA